MYGVERSMCHTIFFKNVIKFCSTSNAFVILFSLSSFVIYCTLLKLKTLTSLFEFKKGRVKEKCYYILSIKSEK